MTQIIIILMIMIDADVRPSGPLPVADRRGRRLRPSAGNQTRGRQEASPSRKSCALEQAGDGRKFDEF